MNTKNTMPNTNPKPKTNTNFLPEIVLNSELTLTNNAKLLKVNPDLFNDEGLVELEKLRAEYEILDAKDDAGLQKTKRDLRNRIRDISTETFIARDPNIFGAMVILILDRLATRPQFSGYTYVNEMKSLATEHILKYTYKFNPYQQSEITGQYVSAFAYISTIGFNAFIATINKMKLEQEKIKTDFLETQKPFHRDHNHSTYDPEFSVVDKIVRIQHLDEGAMLYDMIKMITLDEKNIKVIYPKEYLISLDEYQLITDFSKNNDINLSVVKTEG